MSSKAKLPSKEALLAFEASKEHPELREVWIRTATAVASHPNDNPRTAAIIQVADKVTRAYWERFIKES